MNSMDLVSFMTHPVESGRLFKGAHENDHTEDDVREPKV